MLTSHATSAHVSAFTHLSAFQFFIRTVAIINRTPEPPSNRISSSGDKSGSHEKKSVGKEEKKEKEKDKQTEKEKDEKGAVAKSVKEIEAQLMSIFKESDRDKSGRVRNTIAALVVRVCRLVRKPRRTRTQP